MCPARIRFSSLQHQVHETQWSSSIKAPGFTVTLNSFKWTQHSLSHSSSLMRDLYLLLPSLITSSKWHHLVYRTFQNLFTALLSSNTSVLLLDWKSMHLTSHQFSTEIYKQLSKLMLVQGNYWVQFRKQRRHGGGWRDISEVKVWKLKFRSLALADVTWVYNLPAIPALGRQKWRMSRKS